LAYDIDEEHHMGLHTHRSKPRAGTGEDATRLLIVGGGPRAAMLLERLAANHPQIGAGPLHVDIVDPFRAGAGRIWRTEQSGLLKLNSMAMDVSMFTDDSVTCEGPAVPGPSLWEWVCQLRNGEHRAHAAAIAGEGAGLEGELAALTADAFPTRRLQSRYLAWFLERTLGSLGGSMDVTLHRDTVMDIVPAGPGTCHRARLASGAVLTADLVLLALGHTESLPAESSRRFADFAARHGTSVAHVPPAYTNDADLSGLLPGQDVLVSGMGLAFVDLFVLLMEGRGGRFETRGDGTLAYIPSGNEPVLHVGSRRGVPYLSKIRGALQGRTDPLPRFLTREAVEGLRPAGGLLNFRKHLWPLIAKDAAHAYYRELLTASPHRATMAWEDFAAAYAPLPWYSPQCEALVSQAVPDPEDRLDFESLDHPLASRDLGTAGRTHAAVRDIIVRDLALRDGGQNSETLGLFMGLLGCYMELGRVVSLDELDTPSRQDVAGWWHGFFSYVDSGPPADRLRELLALEEADLVKFLGPRIRFDTDEQRGTFTAQGAVDGHRVHARAFVEARLPGTTLASTSNELLRSLFARGTVSQESTGTGKLLVDGQWRAVDRDGSPHRWLYAVGAGVSGWNSGAFARPHSNAAPFRDTDALARRLLASVPAAAGTGTPQYMSETALAASIDLAHRYAG
jgi:uncharacterized NAD(P)/FAD-binding protein YdhS